jgi:hypothetical protein
MFLEHGWGQWPGGKGRKCPQLSNAEHMQRITKSSGADPANSARRSAVLISVSRSWTALANQFENLTIIVKSEG